MIETVNMSGFGKLLLSGAFLFFLFQTSCSKKEAEPEAAAAAVAQAPAVPELPVDKPRELEEYKDPKGAFVVKLPKGYVFSDKTVGDKVKYIFTYGSSINMILTQGAAPPDWDSEAEMARKQNEIRSGRAGFPPAMVILDRDLLSFGGLKGFQTLLGGNLGGQETQMMAYYLAGEEKLFTLIVTWKDPAASVLNEQLKSSITNSFRLASSKPAEPAPAKPAAAPAAPAVTAAAPVVVTNVPAHAAQPATQPVTQPAARPATNVVARPGPAAKPKPVAPAEPVVPADPRTESEWTAAKAMLKFTGSMKMGGQQVAMVNDKILRIGDTVSVIFHDKEFTFIVMIISPNGVEYKRQLKQ